MKKLSLVALLVILSACKSPQPEGDAIYAKILLEPTVSATCVLFEVRDPADHRVIESRWIPRTDDELEIGVFRGTLPAEVELAARPYLGGDCPGGVAAKTPNGVFETVVVAFGKGITSAGDLRLKPGTDGDGDKYVDSNAGGSDCKDLDGAVNPGIAEQCTDRVDLNCDSAPGCSASSCPSTACVEPTASVVLTVPTSPVTAGACTTGTVQLKDARGANTVATANLSIGLQAVPSAGFTVFSDASCATPATGVNLAVGEGSANFYFVGQVVGTVMVTATASGLSPVTQSIQIVPGPGNRLVFTTPARTAVAGACSAVVTVQSRDAQGNPAPVSAATVISLSAAPPAANLKFFSDAACGAATEVTSANLAAGQSSASFYFKATKTGTATVTVVAPGLTGSSQDQTITPAAPSALVLSGTQTAVAGVCSAAATVGLRDAFGNPTTTMTNRTITLSAGGGSPVSFFANSDCTGTTVTIAQNTGSASFYYRSNTAGSYTVTATATGLTQATLPVTIDPGAPTVLAFTTPAQTPMAGSCSAVATVQLRDNFGNAVRVQADTPVTLSTTLPEGLQFFTDQNCAGTAVTSVNMPATTSTTSFYFKGTKVGSGTLNVAMGTVTGSQSVTINPGAPSVLLFSPSAVPVVAGACTQTPVRVQDSNGNTSPVTTNTVVDLMTSAASGFTFSTAANCSGTSLTQITINSGQSSVTLYVRANVAETVTVTASRTGFTSGTLTLTVSAAAPSKLVFVTPAQAVEVGACSGIRTVEAQDGFNNPSAVAGITVALSANPAPNITFYSDQNCTASVTSLPIAAGQTRASFYFKGSMAENVTITAASAPLTSATQPETITPLPPTALAFTTTEQSVSAGTCSGIVTVQARAQGNPTTVTAPLPVNLAAEPGTDFTFYSNSGCTTVVTQVSIATGQSNASFYFIGTAAGTKVLTASSPGLTSATQNATITAQPASKVAFTSQPYSTVAGACSSLVTIQSTDDYGNPVAVTANKSPGLSVTAGDAQFKFYSDPACTAGNTITSVMIPSGQMTASFYYRGEKARAVTLTAGGNGLSNGTQGHTITASTAAKLAFAASTPPQTVLAGTCALRTVESLDTYGNLAIDAVAVLLSASPQAEFFADMNCTSPVTQVPITAGNSSTSFYFKGISGGVNATAPLGLTASATGLTPTTQTETIIPTVRTGTCSLSSTSVDCNITPALAGPNTSKAFLVFQATSTNTDSRQANVRCYLLDTTQVRCDRPDGGGGNVTIRWSVAEFPTNASVGVQHQIVNCTGNTSTATLAAVVREHTFLLLSSLRDDITQDRNIPRLAELTSTTQAEIRKGGPVGCLTVTDSNHLQAVEYAAASVQRGLTTMASGSASAQVNLSPGIALNRSILLYSYLHDSTSTRICDRLVRGELTSGNTVTFSRGNGDTTNCLVGPISPISWEVVEFPTGTVVQQITKPLAAGAGSGTATLTTPVDLSRTIVIAGGQWASGQLHGESRHSAAEVIAEGRALAFLTDASTLSFSRASSTSSATFTAYVVQLKP